MITSIHFWVTKWEYNRAAPLTNIHTSCSLTTHPLRSNEGALAAGLCFVWTLVLTGEGSEILYYSSEEFYVISDRKITESQLLDIIYNSYDKSNKEVSMRNLKAGLDAAFPNFESIIINVKQIMKVLEM